MDASQENSRKEIKKYSEGRDENTAYSLHGGCAFAPQIVDPDLFSVSPVPGNPNFHLRVGSGEVEVTGKPRRQATARKNQAGKANSAAQNFSPDKLRDICQAIEFKPSPLPGASMLVLLAVSPRLMHAYWEINEQQLAEAREIHGAAMAGAKMILRFHEIAFLGSTTPLNQFDITIVEPCDNWYAHTWNDGKRFFAEIGLQLDNGVFHRLAQSNCILLPPAGPGENPHPDQSGLLDYMYVKENTAPANLPRPEAFAISTGQEVPLVNEMLDESWRDTQAERHVRDVYRRVLAEGPRVLNKRPAILPAPQEKLVDEYHSRWQARRKNRKQNLQNSSRDIFPETAESPGLSADVLALINREDSLNGLWHPLADPEAERRQRPDGNQEKYTWLNDDYFDPESDLLASIVAEEPAAALHFSESVAAPFNNTWPEEEHPEKLHYSGIFAAGKEPPQGNAPLVAILTSPESAPQESPSNAPGNPVTSSLNGLSVDIHPVPLPGEPPAAEAGAGFSPASDGDEFTLAPVTSEAGLPDSPELGEAFKLSAPEMIAKTVKREPPAAPEFPGQPSPPPEITPAPDRSSDFKLTASLTLRGTTPRDTALLLDGREVPTESDGSFEIECDLDEGKLALPFELKSSVHPEVRQRVDIGIDIMKSTQYDNAWDRIRIHKP